MTRKIHHILWNYFTVQCNLLCFSSSPKLFTNRDQNETLLSVWIRCTVRASKTVITTNYASLYGRAFYISSFSTGPDIYIGVSWHSCNCFGSCVLWLQEQRLRWIRSVVLGDHADRSKWETPVTWSVGVARVAPETPRQVLGVPLLWKLRDDTFGGLSVQD